MLFTKDSSELVYVPEGKTGIASLPATTTTVPAGVFSQSPHLTSIRIEDNAPAFTSEGGILYDKDASTLVACAPGFGSSVVIPASTHKIAPQTFAGCALQSVVVLGSVDSIDTTAFDATTKERATIVLFATEDYDVHKALWESAGFTHFLAPATPGDSTGEEQDPASPTTGLTYTLLPDYTLSVSWKGTKDPDTHLTIPASAELGGITYRVSTIAEYAFADAPSLTEVSLPSSVSSIGQAAFKGCSNLTEVTLPEGVTSLGASAFEGSALGRIILPSTLTSVDERVFADISALTHIICRGDVSSVAPSALAGCAGVSVLTPARFEGDYPWTMNIAALGNHIEPYGINASAEPLRLTKGGTTSLFAEGALSVPTDTTLSYAYPATCISVDETGSVRGIAIGSAEVVATLSFEGIELARGVRSVEVAAQEQVTTDDSKPAPEPSSDMFTPAEPDAPTYTEALPLSGKLLAVGGKAIEPRDVGGTAGTCTWSIVNRKLTIGPGTLNNMGGSNYVPWDSERANITSIDIQPGVIAGTATNTMFYDCQNLTAINGLTNLNTSNVTSMTMMFRNCSSLTSLDLSNFTTTNVAYMAYMFQNCPKLTSLNLSKFDTASVINSTDIFSGTTKLETIRIGGGFALDLPQSFGTNTAGGDFSGRWIATQGGIYNYNAYPKGVADTYTAQAAYLTSFNTNGGSAVSSFKTHSGTTIAEPSCSRTGYTLEGWYFDPGLTSRWNFSSQKVVGATTLYAKWTPNTYTINYNGNGSTGGSTGSTSMTYGVSKALSANGFTKSGHTFQGWATTPSGGVTYTNSQVVSDLTATPGGTVTLYAVWKPNTYTIAYNGNGSTGGSTGSTSMTYGVSKALSANGFTKTGHTFQGWATSSGGGVNYTNSQVVSDLTTTLGCTVTLYAVWTPNTYTIAYNGNGSTGGTIEGTPMTYGVSKALTANGFSKTGHTFQGWATSSSGGVTYTNSQVVSDLTPTPNGLVVLYAVWKPHTYTIAYIGNGSTGGSTESTPMTYGVSKDLTANGFSKTGHTFQGWATSPEGSVLYKDTHNVSNLTSASNFTVRLYAKWAPNTYTIHFEAAGGSGTMPDQTGVVYGVATPLKANTYQKEGHSFTGWATSSGGSVLYQDKQSVTSLIASGTTTLYAKWAPNSYNVTFNLDGGSGITSPVEVPYGSLVTDPGTPVKPGYTFKGWYKDASKQTLWNFASDTAGTSTFIYAKWEANGYAVIFDSNDGAGTPMVDQAFTYDHAPKALSTNTYTKQGYTFVGWSKTPGGTKDYDNKQAVQNLALSGSITLYAVWTPITYSVAFHGGSGATGVMEPQTGFVYDTSTALALNSFTKTGHHFDGWTKADGEAKAYTDGQSVKNLTTTQGATVDLWATWKANIYTVRFNSNEGTAVANQSVTYNNHIIKPEDPTRSGYTFAGWYTSTSFIDPWKFESAKVDRDLVLYAKWNAVVDIDIPVDPKITIDAQGKVTAGSASFVSRSAKPVAVVGIDCRTTPTTEDVFPKTNNQWWAIKVTLTDPQKPQKRVEVVLDNDPAVSKYFIIPAAPEGGTSALPIDFGLSLPDNVAITYVDNPLGTPIATLAYTFELVG